MRIDRYQQLAELRSSGKRPAGAVVVLDNPWARDRISWLTARELFEQRGLFVITVEELRERWGVLAGLDVLLILTRGLSEDAQGWALAISRSRTGTVILSDWKSGSSQRLLASLPPVPHAA